MRPLSTINYFLRNKKKLFTSVTIIVVTICFVYIMECFVSSIVQSIYPLDATRFEYASIIISTEDVPEIPQKIIDSLEESQNVKSTMPVTVRQIVFSVPGSTTHTAVFATNGEDTVRLMDEFQMKLSNGRLPENGVDEIAIDSNVAKNNDLKIGSQTDVDVSHNLDRHYTIVGILESDSHISLAGSPTPHSWGLKSDENGYLVFPAKDRFEQVENEVAAFGKQGLNVMTLSQYKKLYAQNTQTFQILNITIIMSIIVMVVCLVCSKYAHFFSRRSEYGVLNALGFSRSEITMRTFREVVLTNLIGFIVDLALAIVLCKIVMSAVFSAVGGVGVYLSWKAVGFSLLAPLLTIVFTLIPVYRLIGRVDTILMIQSN